MAMGQRRPLRRAPRAPQVLDPLKVYGLSCPTTKTGGTSPEPMRVRPGAEEPIAHKDKTGAPA